MAFSNAMELSNNAFFEKKYTLAFQYYQSAIASAPTQKDRLIAESNLATLQSELGMEAAAQKTFPVIQKKSEKSQSQEFKEKLSNEEENQFSAGLVLLNKATEMIEKQKNKSFPYVQRAEIYSLLNQYKNATHDLEHSLTHDATQTVLYKLVNSALLSNDLDTYSYIINTFDEFDGFGALSQGLLLWSTKRYDEALKYINKAVENDEENALVMRAKLYFVTGQINLSYADWIQSGFATDDVIFVLKFLKDPLIPREPNDDSWKSYALRHFRAGVFKSLYSESMSRVPLDLWVPLPVQNEWASGGVKRYEPVPLCQQEQAYPEGFAIGLSEEQRTRIKQLFPNALKIGMATSPRESSKRAFQCIGMAVLELREQLLSNPLSVSQAAAIACHWLHLIDPLQALFMRSSLREITSVLHIQRDLFSTDLINYQQILIGIVKEKLLDGVSDSTETGISVAKTVEDIWNVLRSDVCIKYDKSDIEIFIRKMPAGNIEFGICIPSNAEHWNELSQADIAWASMMSSLGKGRRADAIDSLLKFIYYWMRASPLTAQSHTVGMIIFHALMIYMIGRVCSNLPSPINVQMEALLASDFPSFKASIVSHMKTPFVAMNINELPLIGETLPNFPSRISALLFEQVSKN